jgi:putative transposase
LGLWIEQNEGAKFWLRVMNELKNRGTEDILLAVVDGLKGFPDAIRAVFPEATVQTCIVHLLRTSLDFVSLKDRKAVATAFKDIYRAKDDLAATMALDAFEAGPWGVKYPRNRAELASCLAGGHSGSTPSLVRSAASSTPRMPSKR